MPSSVSASRIILFASHLAVSCLSLFRHRRLSRSIHIRFLCGAAKYGGTGLFIVECSFSNVDSSSRVDGFFRGNVAVVVEEEER